MHTVSSDIDIALPVRTVYNQWTQFEDFPAFMSGVKRVEQVTDTHLEWEVNVAGADRDFEAEITEQVPDERIAWKSVSGPKHAGVVTFHRLGDAETRVRLQLDWDPQGLVEKAGALLNLDDAQVGGDLRTFAKLMESNGFETGAWRGEVDAPGGTSAPGSPAPGATAAPPDDADLLAGSAADAPDRGTPLDRGTGEGLRGGGSPLN